jgi:pyruvate decarboxylase
MFRYRLHDCIVSLPGVAEAVQSSDLVLHIGPLLSSSNTGAFTRQIKYENLVSLGHAFCQIQDKRYEGVHFLPVIQRIVAEIKKNTSAYNLPRDIAPKIHVSLDQE